MTHAITEQQLETEIQAKGLTAPRLTPQDVDALIRSAEYALFGGRLTICVLTLTNGCLVTGESAPASLDNFNAELGQKAAYSMARNKIWELEGYALRSRLCAR